MQMPKRHASDRGPSSLRVTAEEIGRRENPLLPSPWTLDEDSWRDLGPVACRILISLVRDRALEKFSYFLTRLR
jgi:hypothetical protein